MRSSYQNWTSKARLLVLLVVLHENLIAGERFE
jgi:hypothetical protein